MRPAELLERLRGGVLLLDGGLGSMLIAAGLEPGQAPESWNLEHPERVEAIHRAYVEAGSDLIHSNTFGANEVRLAGAGLDGRVLEINSAGVSIARRASGGRALVAGDVGPTGQALPPVGNASLSEMRKAFHQQIAILAHSGADLISIETMSDLREAVVAVEVARAMDLAVVASMTFELRKRGAFTIMGDPLIRSLETLAAAGATVVGFNCSTVSAEMLRMVREAVPRLEVPLAAQPNAGRPRLTLEGVVYDEDPSGFAADLAAMVAAGARLVGGCCGTTPEFIRLAREAIAAAVTQSN